MATYRRGKIWWVKIYIPGQDEPLRRSSKSTRESDAKLLERTLLSQLAENTRRGLQGFKPQRNFIEAVAYYIESGAAPVSMKAHIKQTAKLIGPVPLDEDHLIPAIGRMKSRALADHTSPLTVNRRLSVIRRILNLAYKEWRWLDSPMAEFVSPMIVSEQAYARHVYLTKERVHELFSQVGNREIRKAFFGLVFSGLRVSELLALTPEQWTGTAIRLNAKTKGKRPRSIPIPPFARPIFEDLPFKVRRGGLVYWMTKVRGEEDIRIHDLRHTFASWLVDDPTIPMTMIRDILGHTSVSTTNRYIHIRNERLTLIEGAIPEIKWDE